MSFVNYICRLPQPWILLHYYITFEKSVMQGKYPTVFKHAAVVPIFKPGDRTQVSTYFFISLINSVAKFVGICIKKNLLSYLLEDRIFYPYHFGLLPNRVTDLAVKSHINSIADAISSSKYTAAF